MRILLLSSNKFDLDFIQVVAKPLNLPVKVMPTADEVCSEIQKDPQALVFVDASTEKIFQQFETTLGSKLGLFNEAVNPNRFFFILQNDLFDTAPYVMGSDLLGHVLVRSYKPGDEKKLQPMLKFILSTNMHSQAFKIENFFAEGVKTQSVQVTHSSHKRSIIESLKNNLLNIGFKSRMATVISTAADEIIMNAIFDAPIDATGKYIYAQMPRNTEMQLTDRNIVEFKLAFDGELLGLSVLDQHGSLDKKKLFSHLSKSYKSDDFKVKTNIAGAGLGLMNVVQNCGGAIFECELGVKTQVTLLYKKTPTFITFKDQFRFISTLMYFA